MYYLPSKQETYWRSFIHNPILPWLLTPACPAFLFQCFNPSQLLQYISGKEQSSCCRNRCMASWVLLHCPVRTFSSLKKLPTYLFRRSGFLQLCKEQDCGVQQHPADWEKLNGWHQFMVSSSWLHSNQHLKSTFTGRLQTKLVWKI